MKAIDPFRVQSLVETHLDNLIADIQKELALDTREAAARFFSGLKRQALVTIISAERYAGFACGDAEMRVVPVRRRDAR